MESVIKHAEESRNRSREAAKIIHNNDYQPLKHDIDRMRRDYLGLERLPELYEIESDLTPEYEHFILFKKGLDQKIFINILKMLFSKHISHTGCS